MNIISDRVANLNESASLSASTRARALVRQGVDVISLATGEPDFDTPEHVVDAALAAMRSGRTRYAAAGGAPELKDAIIRKFARDNGLCFDNNEVMVGSGLKNVIYLALLASVNEGDEIIVPAPYWVSYTEMASLAGGVPKVVQTREVDGFKLTPPDLEAAITPRTRWLILNTPSNPTGAVYNESELKALAEVLRLHEHVLVMTDEIYEHIIFDGLRFSSFCAVAPDLSNRILTLNGVSKAYAMTGWRIGFAAGPADLISAMKKVQSQSSGSNCSISEAAAIAALDGPQDFLAQRSASFQTRRDRIYSMLTDMPFRCQLPQGAFYLFLGVSELLGKTSASRHKIATDDDVTRLFLEEARVMTVLGSAYGLSPYIRISIATSLERLEEAIHRIRNVIRNVN